MKFKDCIPPFLYNEPTLNFIYNAQEEWIEKDYEVLQDILNQAFVDTATWGLDIWEKERNIPINHNDSYEVRRARVKAKKYQKHVCNVDLLKLTAKAFFDGDIEVERHDEDDYFIIKFISTTGKSPYSMKDLKNSIEDIKPAHMDYTLSIVCFSNLVLETRYKEYRQYWLMCGEFYCGEEPHKQVYDRISTTLQADTIYYDYKQGYLMVGETITGGEDI